MRKKLQDLTIKDAFMFAAVMSDEEQCRHLLKLVLLTGETYDKLPDTYVIFICNFDPLGQKKCRYTIRRYCEETGNVFGDGVCTVFLNTNGENREEVPKELTSLLDFVKADLIGSEDDYEDIFVKQLQNSMRQIKRSRKMGE